MFIIRLTYTKPLEVIDQHIAVHRAFLDEGYKNGFFLASGPQNPRTGGIIISLLKDRVKLDELIKQDPFHIEQVAEYEVIEFNPVKFHSSIADLV